MSNFNRIGIVTVLVTLMYLVTSCSAFANNNKIVTEALVDLEKDSFFCLRDNKNNACIVECKRRDGKPLGLIEDDVTTRRAFAFTLPNQDKTGGPGLVHIRQLPFSYGKLGGSVWYASVALGQYLALNPEIVRNKRVLELGAGVGLPGLCVSKYCEPKSITLTEFGFDGDIDGPVIMPEGEDMKRLLPSALLKNLEFNVKLNQGRNCRVQHLDWFDFLPSFDRRGDDDKIQLSNNTIMSEHFDVVIGSDLVNWQEDVQPLIQTIKYFVSSGSLVLIVLSVENRQALPTFMELLGENFENVCVEELSIVQYEEHPLRFITIYS